MFRTAVRLFWILNPMCCGRLLLTSSHLLVAPAQSIVGVWVLEHWNEIVSALNLKQSEVERILVYLAKYSTEVQFWGAYSSSYVTCYLSEGYGLQFHFTDSFGYLSKYDFNTQSTWKCSHETIHWLTKEMTDNYLDNFTLFHCKMLLT